MKLLIINVHSGLRDPRSREVVPLDRQVIVDDSAFWRRRAEQGHVELIKVMTDVEARQYVRDEAVASVKDEKNAAAAKKAKKASRKKTAPAAPPTEPTSGSEE